MSDVRLLDTMNADWVDRFDGCAGLAPPSFAVSPLAERLAASVAVPHAAWLDHLLHVWVSSCESPIEAAYLATFLAWATASRKRVWVRDGRVEMFWRVNDMSGVPGDRPPQCIVSDYVLEIQRPMSTGHRVDFLLTARQALSVDNWRVVCTSVVVECDGHDFHERTKEQASADRSRDRALQAAGFVVLRYTGSDLWRSPFDCLVDSIRTLDRVHAERKS